MITHENISESHNRNVQVKPDLKEYIVDDSISMAFKKTGKPGAPGWLSWLSVCLQLRS